VGWLSIVVWIIKLNSEVEIWLPFLVVNDGNWDNKLLLSGLHCHDIINWGIVHVSLGSSINSSNTHGNFLLVGLFTLLDHNLNLSTALSN